MSHSSMIVTDFGQTHNVIHRLATIFRARIGSLYIFSALKTEKSASGNAL